jgi:NTE family protein
MLGLVLTAGGARGAYQAGVLKRIGELPVFRRGSSPFRIIAGASAGAINGSTLAAMSGNFYAATRFLAQLWSDLRVPDVYRTDARSLSLNGLRFLQDLLFGGAIGGAGVQSLLNATPLRAFLQDRLPLSGIGESIRRGHLYAIAVTATSYHSGKSFTFIQGQPGHPVWRKARRVALPAKLSLDHVLASAAIPIVFQPVRLRTAAGEFWFGDGGLRLVTPLSPAIRLGASKLFAVGIRCQRSADDLSQTELLGTGDGKPVMPQPPLSQICGVLLNAIFLDHLDTDLDHLKRMNELILAHGNASEPAVPSNGWPTPSEPMRCIESLVINPSEDLAIVARHLSHRMPRLVRYLLEGLGTPDAQSADLTSYLLFDSAYTRALVDIGYRDAGARIDAIESFLAADQSAAALPVRARASGSPATSAPR